MEDVMDGVCDRVWVFGKDSFEECPLTAAPFFANTTLFFEIFLGKSIFYSTDVYL